LLKPFDPEERVPVSVFRRDQLLTFDVELQPARTNVIYLLPDGKDPEAVERRDRWLGDAANRSSTRGSADRN
jgi:predicted metalloprotease with PDZ domain